MIKYNKLKVGGGCVYTFENVPDNFESIVSRIINEANSHSFRFNKGTKYEGLTIVESFIKYGKDALFYAYKLLNMVTDANIYAGVIEAIKFCVKKERKIFTLEDVLILYRVFEEEIRNYEQVFSINLKTAVLDDETKVKIKDYLLY